MTNVVSEYINKQPDLIRKKLIELREIILEVCPPEIIETISYGIPTYKLQKNIVHFAGFKNHIGLYPTPVTIQKFKNELIKYKTSKGAIQFPISNPLPKSLIKKIVKSNL